MLKRDSPPYAFFAQNVSLLVLSFIFLPFDTFVLFVTYLSNRLFPSYPQNAPPRHRKTILVTGVGMSKGLVLARLFHKAGHRVIGADFEPRGARVCGRVSNSLTRFRPLTKPTEASGSAAYTADLLRIIKHERVDLWVSCSGVASAVMDGEAKEAIEKATDCRAIQYNIKTTEMLHEKHSFIAHTASLGLTVPETHTITDRGAVRDIFADAKQSGRKYIMKPVGMDDSARADMTLLPRPSPAETDKHLARLNITPSNPWIVQQFIRGGEYCTHALVVRGRVKAFAACPSAELLMHYEPLPDNAPLTQAMLAFTRTYAKAGGKSFTGHLSFDFLVEEADARQKDPAKITLYPIECNPRAHTAVVFFNDTPAMVEAYLSLLEDVDVDAPLVTPVRPAKYYWIGHDLVEMGIISAYGLFDGMTTLNDYADELRELLSHILTWRDGTYERWDPLPWWWLYHVYWPMQFLNSILYSQPWSRINVSTTKMFGV